MSLSNQFIIHIDSSYFLIYFIFNLIIYYYFCCELSFPVYYICFIWGYPSPIKWIVGYLKLF